MKKLLIGYDGSEPARAAAETAGALAQHLGARLTVLTALSTVSWVGKTVIPTAEPAEVLSAVSVTAELASTLRIDAEVQIEFGDPAIALKVVAEREEYDLIVVGHRGLGGVAGMILGSVAKVIAAEAPCPVLIVKGTTRKTFSRALVAADGSRHARRAAEAALSIARAFGARVTIVNVIDSTVLSAEKDPSAVQRLRHELSDRGHRALSDITEACVRWGVDCDAVQEEGRPDEVICRLARSGAYELVAVGRRGQSVLARLALASVSDEVIKNVDAAVLVAGARALGTPVGN